MLINLFLAYILHVEPEEEREDGAYQDEDAKGDQAVAVLGEARADDVRDNHEVDGKNDVAEEF